MTHQTRPRAPHRWLRLAALASALGLALLSLGALPANAAGEGSVSGVVTHDGAPAGGVTVNLYPVPGFSTSTVTNGLGEYTFDNIDLGDYTVSIFEQASDPGGHPVLVSDTVTLTLEAPDVVINMPLTSWPTGTGSITGEVTDSASGDPIATAYYYFSGMGQAASSNGFVDGSGVYAISHLPAGDYSNSIGAPGYISVNSSVSVEDGETVVRDVALVAANATITGHVEDSEGNAVANESVSISNGDPMGFYSVMTDPSGNYSKDELGAGNYTVSVGGSGTAWQLTSQPVTAIASDTVTADFVVTPRITASISGRVFESVGSARVSDICTTVYDTAGDVVGGALRTDASGNYAVEDLEAGDYVLLFWDCDNSRRPAYAFTYYGGASNFAAATVITVTAGVDEFGKNVTLSLGGSISGHIDLAAPGGTVDLPSYGGMDATTFQLVGGDWVEFPDESPYVGGGDWGDYEVVGLPDGTYRIGFIDQRTGPRAYTPQYWNNQPTLAGATNIVISGGNVVTGVDASMVIPRPGDAPAAVATDDLTPAEEGEIASDPDAAQGETIEVQVDPDLAGEWVSVWGHSTPVLLGNWVQVSTTGKVTVPISSTMPTGAHQLV
ncbi:MAG: carboxypeptidase regulatory-like domain-containing protein, partial [Rhodoglobus sp.]